MNSEPDQKRCLGTHGWQDGRAYVFDPYAGIHVWDEGQFRKEYESGDTPQPEIGKLLKLADYVETIEPEKFDMNRIATHEGQVDEFGRYNSKHQCFSAGCMLGHATAVFPELWLSPGMGWIDRNRMYLCSEANPISITKRAGFGLAAAQDFFGLTFDQAMWLFSEGDDDQDKEGAIPDRSGWTPFQAAKHIREWCRIQEAANAPENPR